MPNKRTNTQILLDEYIQQEYKENQQQYMSENDFFEFFSASQILKEYDFSDEEIERGICGGGLDGGCDALYLIIDDMLADENIDGFKQLKKGTKLNFIIIQAKNTNGFDETSISNLKTTCTNLFDMDKNIDSFSGRYNEQVRIMFSQFRKICINLVRKSPEINIKYYYVSKGIEVHPNVQKQADELCEILKPFFPYPRTNIIFNFVDAERLYQLANTNKNNEFPLRLSANPIINDRAKVYISLVRLVDYYNFITDDNHELIRHIFEANVRDYQGKVAVNKDIQETLGTPGEDNFWWLNNGVTIVASDVIPQIGKDVLIVAPEIVNGLQTSTEIFKYFKQNPTRLDIEERELLVRIIVPTNEDTRDKIIFATNNQTTIQKSSLRATDVIHRQIEMYFKGKELFYDRRKNYYKNNGKKSSQIISLPFLSQCLISVLLQSPNEARARPSTLLTDESRYKKLYRSNLELDVFYNIAVIGRRVETVLKRNDQLSNSDIINIKFYVIFTLFVNIFKHPNINPQEIANMQIEQISDEFIQQIIDDVLNVYRSLGGNDRVAKSSELINALKQSLEFKYSSTKDM